MFHERPRMPGIVLSRIAILLFSFVISAVVPMNASGAGGPLAVPPYVGLPTESSVVLNLLAGDAGASLKIRYHREGAGTDTARQTETIEIPAGKNAEARLSGLDSGTSYVYDVLTTAGSGTDDAVVASGRFVTRRTGVSNFSFGIMSDAHITPVAQERSPVLRAVADTMASRRPEFVLALGDNIQALTRSHGGPFALSEHPAVAYRYYRQVLGRLASETSIFNVIGNWEGENGWHAAEPRRWARDTRLRMIPTPRPGDYPEGGSEDGDYYAFTWGNVLCVVLTVTGHTPNDHALGSRVGRADDWTLGDAQFAWLKRTLERSKDAWKLIFIHHTVGGRAGDDLNSRYGRGGARAARVGEQEKVHQLMLKHGVQAFFYGHDHVFTSDEADGIPYVCVGSAGAPWKFGPEETGYPWHIPDSGFVWVEVDGNVLHVSYITPDASQPGGRELKRFDIPRTRKR